MELNMDSGELVSISRFGFSPVVNSPRRTERMKNPESRNGAEKTYGRIESNNSLSLPVPKNMNKPKTIKPKGASNLSPPSMIRQFISLLSN
jgi:hypothetical protein